MMMNEVIIESTGNVFVDLGFDPGEAAILQMRAKLLNDLRTYVEASGMTQVEVAEQFGLGHSRVLDLIHGKWEKFSLEILIMLAAKAGRQVQLEFVT
jgi:predicted XRE-type DNA-binding protein